MPLNHRQKSVSSRRMRPAHVSCRGGASSLLRLTVPSAQRLPTAHDLSGWMGRAADALLPVTGPHFDFSAPTLGAAA